MATMSPAAFAATIIAGVGVAKDAHRWVGGEHPLDALCCRFGSVGDDDLTGVKAVAHADPAAVVQ